MSEPQLSLEQKRYRAMSKTTWVGVVVNIILAVSKIVGGILGNAHSLVADGLHSFADLATDAMVLFTAKHAAKEADEDHPYGHARFETIATVLLSLFLLAVAFGIGYDAVIQLGEPELLQAPDALTLFVALFSVAANEGLYQYTHRVAKQVRSKLLEANAWHHRSDAISSVVVVIGIGGALLGIPSLDAVAALLVGLMIAKIAWKLGWESLHELADAGLEPETLEKIREVINNIDGVRNLHMLRTRRMGGNALADVHIQVSPRLSVSEGHRISDAVRLTLIDRVDELSDVTVHIDPEDDEQNSPCLHLPLRKELMADLQPHIQQVCTEHQIEEMRLHYLNGRINLEIILSPQESCNREEIEAIKQAAQAVEHIGAVEILQRIALV